MIVVPPYLRAILSTRLTRWTRWEPLESKIRYKPATFVHEIHDFDSFEIDTRKYLEVKSW